MQAEKCTSLTTQQLNVKDKCIRAICKATDLTLGNKGELKEKRLGSSQ